MKTLSVFIMVIACLQGCADRQKISDSPATDLRADTLSVPGERPVFFQVTSFLKGQIYELEHGGMTPIRYTLNKGRQDSAWLQTELLETEFSDFLTPVIDSTSLSAYFNEKKFLDQTLNLVTLTYDPVSNLPDSILLRHLDVYIDPENGVIRRIYFVNQLGKNRLQQLTWTPGKASRNVIINENNGRPVIEKQVEIKWDY